VARACALRSEYPQSVLARSEPSIDSIEDAALAGDALALQIAREAAENLGIAVAGMLNLMNPAMVILGGGLARLGDVLLEPLRETVRRRTLVSSVAVSEIRTSELGPQSIAVGAATLILQAALADSSLFHSALSSVEAP
jgi:predicted NBD/HSP70 family sugar kinase